MNSSTCCSMSGRSGCSVLAASRKLLSIIALTGRNFHLVKLIEDVFSREQKDEMIRKVTDAMVSIEGENLREKTVVIIEESVKNGDWGVGGRGLTTEHVKKAMLETV
jgi:4-oxalocrotonate tautomerase